MAYKVISETNQSVASDFKVTYPIKTWVTSPLTQFGYGLTCFDRLTQALDCLVFNQWKGTLYKCVYRSKMELPDMFSFNFLRALCMAWNYGNEDDLKVTFEDFEDFKFVTSCWPDGTIMAERIMLTTKLAEIRTGYIANLVHQSKHYWYEGYPTVHSLSRISCGLGTALLWETRELRDLVLKYDDTFNEHLRIVREGMNYN